MTGHLQFVLSASILNTMPTGSIAKKIIVIIGCIMAVSVVGFMVYQYTLLRAEVTKLKSSPQAVQEAAKAENNKLIERVRTLITVPSDETPTIATVTDSEKLKNNAFFVNAQNGDKVLIYSTAKKAVIYRPGENKIVEVGPISIGTPSASTAEKPVSFILYNGTEVTGLTKKYEATLKDAVKNAVVSDRDNAKKRDYETSMIVDVSGAHAAEAAVIAEKLRLTVSTLPAGETKPSTGDFLIILGADRK